MRRSTVLSLPLQYGFPGLHHSFQLKPVLGYLPLASILPVSVLVRGYALEEYIK
jgi:hypothetical protein